MTDPDTCFRRRPAVELLAPAGGPDAGYAALHYGADAVYLGLSRLSARAEAENFTPEQLDEFAAYAHHSGRRVYLTLNTLVQDRDLGPAAEALAVARDCGVDAVIIQDLGVAELAARHFPRLRRHASTQLAIHNRDGARAAADLGFSRVTLARELTLEEVADIVAATAGPDGPAGRDGCDGPGGLEIETFIHGTLCYSYSGLCLFSSMHCGRSGNRGRCIYTCREAADTPRGRAHPFSLKDLALGPRVLDLAAAGVASLKIEGRKKSPLYVAAVVNYYRRLLDGRLDEEAAWRARADCQTIFARPWTTLFLDGRRNPEAADAEVVGHRGLPLGAVDRLAATPAGPGVVFTPAAPVERHDGVQIDVPGSPRPFGFPVDALFVREGGRWRPVFAAGAGQTVAVALPGDAPPLAPGLPLYQSSSQAVKRSYPFERPRPGAFRTRLALAVAVEATGDGAAATATLTLPDGEALTRCVRQAALPTPARDPAGAEAAARGAFERLGDSPFRLAGWEFANPENCFLPPKFWNALRRELVAVLETAAADHAGAERAALREAALAGDDRSGDGGSRSETWGLAVDDAADLAALTREDFAWLGDIAVTLSAAPDFADVLAAAAERAGPAGRERLRIALPLIARPPQAEGWKRVAAGLVAAGWRNWLVPNLYGVRWLMDCAGADAAADLDLVADWSLYTLNRRAAAGWRKAGFAAVTLSPEDDRNNLVSLLGAAPEAWVPVYATLPLFLSAACARLHLGLCHGTGKPSASMEYPACGEPLEIRLERSGGAVVRPLPWGCGTVVTGAAPYSLLPHLDTLRGLGARRFRLDLRWGRPGAADVASLCQTVRRGESVAGTAGNFGKSLV